MKTETISPTLVVEMVVAITVALVIAMTSLAIHAQQPSIPFNRIQRESQPRLHQMADVTAATTTDGSFSSLSASAAPALGMAYTRPAAPRIPRVFDRKFFLLNALHLGMALADVGLAQHCIAEHQCKEANPLMPSSRAGQFSVSLGMFAFTSGESYWLKKHRARSWWEPPTAGIVAHIVGVASEIAR
jgi:hypothetical protein